MNTEDETLRRIQATARSTAARTGTSPPTQEHLIRHLLESFLDRLSRTDHSADFVLEGGILLAAYGRGYAPETTVAEKGVTILERGITGTRWRDYVDIVQLARQASTPTSYGGPHAPSRNTAA